MADLPLEEIRQRAEAMLRGAELDPQSFRTPRDVLGKALAADVGLLLSEVTAQRAEVVPDYLAEHSAHWLAANEKAAAEVRWGRFPLGMVQRWIERAEEAETVVVGLREQLQRQDNLEDLVEEMALRVTAEERAERLEEALRTICDIGETRDVQVARAALGEEIRAAIEGDEA